MRAQGFSAFVPTERATKVSMSSLKGQAKGSVERGRLGGGGGWDRGSGVWRFGLEV